MFNFEGRNIKRYLYVYWEEKKENPSLNELDIQEKVVEVHLKSGNGPKSISTGKQYIKAMWPDKNIDIVWLVSHLISWDFPKKYTPLEEDSEDIYELQKRIREGKKDKWEMLEEKIQRYSEEIQNKVLRK